MKQKNKARDEHDFPIKVNMLKCLAEERRQLILDFSKVKLTGCG